MKIGRLGTWYALDKLSGAQMFTFLCRCITDQASIAGSRKAASSAAAIRSNRLKIVSGGTQSDASAVSGPKARKSGH